VSQRDDYIRNNRLESNKYPFAEFTATGVEGLPARYTEGQDVPLRIAGNMTIREIARPVSFDGQARLEGNTLTGTITARFPMTAFGVEPPTALGSVQVEDELAVTVQFTAEAVGA
jgi:polyisoprenoid-binding protein YceI